jgi:uncharacterized membrane protein YdcZ (DUF606 family)
MLTELQSGAISCAVVTLGVLGLSWLLMRTLWLPRMGCWLFYLSTLIGIFIALVTGLALIVVSLWIKHFLDDPANKNAHLAWLGGVVVVLMFVGKELLKARQKNPFQSVMRWFLNHSFTKRVGDILPPYPIDDPRRLAFRAVFDPAYPDKNYGSVDGWGVKASCKRLIRIKHNK